MTVEMNGYWIGCYYGDNGELTLCSPASMIFMKHEDVLEHCKPNPCFPKQKYIPCKVMIEVPKEMEDCVAKNIRTLDGDSFIFPDPEEEAK